MVVISGVYQYLASMRWDFCNNYILKLLACAITIHAIIPNFALKWACDHVTTDSNFYRHPSLKRTIL